LSVLRPAKAKSFRLANYGLEVHLPAVNVELCLEAGVAEKLHTMLVMLRSCKQGTNKGMLRASAAPLPKREPWDVILRPAPSPLQSIIANKRARKNDAISTRGERGDGRELRPQAFHLSCPSCSNLKNCVRVKLFTTTARGLTCNNCKLSTSSTRWLCAHGIPWTRCYIHREPGFRCGAQGLPHPSS